MAQPSAFLTLLTAIVVSIVWIGSLIVGAIQKDWTPLGITTPVVLSWLAGHALANRVIERQSDNKTKNGKEDRWSHMP